MRKYQGRRYMGVSQNWGYRFGGPHNKDYSILGSILGSPYFGKVQYKVVQDFLNPHWRSVPQDPL